MEQSIFVKRQQKLRNRWCSDKPSESQDGTQACRSLGRLKAFGLKLRCSLGFRMNGILTIQKNEFSDIVTRFGIIDRLS